MIRPFARIAAAVAALVLVLPGATGAAQEDEGTRIESLSATVSGGSVFVQGTATFVDAPEQVATDPAGDATPANVGADLTAGIISRPDPSRSELVFRLDVADDIPVLFGLPETMHYGWAFGVSTGSGVGQEFLLQSLRTAQSQTPGNPDPFFRLLQFRADGTCCNPVVTLAGTMADGVLTWTLPLARIGAQNGGSIEPHSARPIQVQIGASGQQWLNTNQPDQMWAEGSYQIPTARVRLGIAPAGTPEDLVQMTASASVSVADGAFSGALPTPTEPGSYLLVAEACYTADGCARGSTTITI